MRTLYLDCGMGAAGDMLAAALLELVDEPDEAVAEFNALGVPGVTFRREAAQTCGIGGTHLAVEVDGAAEEPGGGAHGHDGRHSHACRGDDGADRDHGGHSRDHAHDGLPRDHDHPHDIARDHAHSHGADLGHHHSGMRDIEHVVRDRLDLPDRVRDDVVAVFGLIAEAESAVHGVPVPEIHFHEVGTMDAIADVAAVCLLMDRIAPNEVVASPVNVGGGTVRCAHGVLPVPAPATARILRDVPVYGGEIESELCTPTGAALLRRFVTRFGRMPVMRVGRIGYGIGTKRFERANCVRALLGEADGGADETIVTLSCSVDDMTAEDLGFATEELLAAGALEAFTTPIGMKKSRPGTLLTVMCRESDRDRVVRLVFGLTTTIGVRESIERRYALDRAVETVATPLGDVRVKVSSGYGVRRAKPEFDDLARLARDAGTPIGEVRRVVERAIADRG